MDKFSINRLDGHEEEKPSSLSFKHPHKNFSSTKQKRWLETWIRMGVRRPVLHLRSKRVSLSDTKPNQLGLQLTATDIFIHASDELRELAKMAYQLKGTGFDVKIMDRNGNKYHNIRFNYFSSSDTYRFCGPGYTEFLVRNNLKENQFLDIWGLPINRGDGGDIWFAFVNYS